MNSLDRYRNSHGEVWLNVASSIYVLEGFVNLDNHVLLRFAAVYPVIKVIFPGKYRVLIEQYRAARNKAALVKHDCRKPLPVASESVNHILCSHFLEHVYPVEADHILRDFHRALEANGTLHVIVPDLKDQVLQYLRHTEQGMAAAAEEFIKETLLARESKGTLKYRLLEFSGGFGLQHRWMYDHPSMEAKLKHAGFDILAVNDTPSKNYRLNDGSVHIVARKKAG
jgi:hypothetical protein